MVRNTFLETLSSYEMDRLMEEKKAVIVAFSGGADSALLLRLLHDYTGERDIRLCCAHLNHQIRGAEADRDEKFARETAAALDIPIYVKRADVPAYAREHKLGLEEAAREVRYAFFAELSASMNHAPVATAHNADDCLETVLFHLMRGTGLRGLCGIAPVRDDCYLRPLIGVTGKEIRDYCLSHGIPYVVDSTNQQTEYTRNHIRQRVVPALEEVFTRPQETVLRMTELLRQDSDYLELEAAVLCPSGTVVLDRAVVRELHPAIGSRVLLGLHRNSVSTETPSLAAVHVKEMLRLIHSENSEGWLSLPGEIRFHMTRMEIRFVAEEETISGKKAGESGFSIGKDGGKFENERYLLLISQEEHMAVTEEYENIYKLSIHQKIGFDKIIGVFYIKYRNPGDTYRYGGMTRKLKQLMIDRKLSAEEKALLPLLWDDDGMVWMPFCPVADRVRPDQNEKILYLHFYVK